MTWQKQNELTQKMVGKFVLKLATNVDQQFFRRYLDLTESQRRMVRDVVGEFKSAGVV